MRLRDRQRRGGDPRRAGERGCTGRAGGEGNKRLPGQTWDPPLIGLAWAANDTPCSRNVWQHAGVTHPTIASPEL